VIDMQAVATGVRGATAAAPARARERDTWLPYHRPSIG
jgi:hypothetical protein